MKDIKDRRGGSPLTKDELNTLEKALEALEHQYDMPLLPVAELFDYDDEYVDIVVKFEDENEEEEHLALERNKLHEGLHATVIAQWINQKGRTNVCNY